MPPREGLRWILCQVCGGRADIQTAQRREQKEVTKPLPITWNVAVVKRDSAEVGGDAQVEAPLLPFSSQLTDAQRQDGLLLVRLPGQLQQHLKTMQTHLISPDRGRKKANGILGLLFFESQENKDTNEPP